MSTVFFPGASNIPAVKCNHRWDCGATFSEQTDSIVQSSCYTVEMYAFRHNMRIGAFNWDRLSAYQGGITESEATGVIRYDVYFPDDWWVNPDGQLTLIPDFNYDTWTANGAKWFSGAIEGQPKPTRYPNHGQQLFDISGGVFGYDYVNGISGTNKLQEFNYLVDYCNNWLKSKVHRLPSSASWREGNNQGWLVSISRYISVRNSFHDGYPSTDTPNSWYGPGLGQGDSWIQGPLNRTYTNNYSSTSRFWDRAQTGWGTIAETIQWMHDLVYTIYVKKGWFRDFTHWHGMQKSVPITLYQMNDMFESVRAAMDDGMDWWTCSNGEAWEYLYVRELCERVNATEFVPGKVNIVIDVKDRFKGTFTNGLPNDIDLDCLNIPLCVRVDLSNTTLAGKNVKATSGKMRNKGNNIYVVEVPFTKEEGFSNVVIQEGEDGYHIESRPVITKSISGTTMTITTDIPTRCVLFSTVAGDDEQNTLVLNNQKDRSNKLDTTHTFEIQSGYDYRVGAISEYGQTSLLEA